MFFCTVFLCCGANNNETRDGIIYLYIDIM